MSLSSIVPCALSCFFMNLNVNIFQMLSIEMLLDIFLELLSYDFFHGRNAFIEFSAGQIPNFLCFSR